MGLNWFEMKMKILRDTKKKVKSCQYLFGGIICFEKVLKNLKKQIELELRTITEWRGTGRNVLQEKCKNVTLKIGGKVERMI